MINIKKQYEKDFGYIPSDAEILDLFYQGQIILTDKQENEIIKYFNL